MPTGGSALIVETDMTGLPARLASHKETTQERPARHGHPRRHGCPGRRRHQGPAMRRGGAAGRRATVMDSSRLDSMSGWPRLSLAEWTVLAVVSEGPTHGFAIAQLTAP